MFIGKGIFGWDGSDRRTRRYGGVQLDAKDYDERAKVVVEVNKEAILGLQGRVRLYAKVVDSRVSGHVGDSFIKVKPTQPEVGEIVELGVGHLDMEPCGYSPTPCILLKPEDGRQEFWMDPHKLYRLHDQTVELYAEETSEPCHEAPHFDVESGMKSNGDGSFQVSGVVLEEIDQIKPKVQKVPEMEHTFMVSTDFNEGEDIQFTKKGEHLS